MLMHQRSKMQSLAVNSISTVKQFPTFSKTSSTPESTPLHSHSLILPFVVSQGQINGKTTNISYSNLKWLFQSACSTTTSSSEPARSSSYAYQSTSCHHHRMFATKHSIGLSTLPRTSLPDTSTDRSTVP